MTIAAFRGWTPAVALQLEHSLLERTVEGKLLPMSQELGRQAEAGTFVSMSGAIVMTEFGPPAGDADR